eukprot:scaffold3971_cov417-Prasinococcus_capsulatus_cf.AAC.3
MAPPRRRLWQEALLLLISAGIHSANSSPETYSFEPERRSFIQTDTARAAGLLASDVGRNSSQPHNRLDLRSSWEDASCTASVPRQTHMDVVIPFYEKVCNLSLPVILLCAYQSVQQACLTSVAECGPAVPLARSYAQSRTNYGYSLPRTRKTLSMISSWCGRGSR